MLFPRFLSADDILMVGKDSIAHARFDTFFRFFSSFGALNAGWIVLTLLAFQHKVPAKQRAALAAILGVAAASLLFWVVAIFGPGGTVSHHGSYASNLLLAAGLCVVIGLAPRYVGGLIAACTSYQFFQLVIAHPLAASPSTQALAGATLLAGLFLMIWVLAASFRLERLSGANLNQGG